VPTDTRTHIDVVPRKDFVREFGDDYGDGQHVTMIGPTQRGKSTLSGQLQHRVASPDRQVVVLHGKILHRDPVIPRLAERNGYRVIHEWPPTRIHRRPVQHSRRKVNGYILVPLQQASDARTENELLRSEFSKAIQANYQNTKKKTITVVDERAQAEKDLKLQNELDGPLQRGAPDNAEWNHIQRGAWVSYHCYDAPAHMFIFHDDHLANRKRYSEFGCADPDEILYLTEQLDTREVKSGGTISQCLYMRRSDRYMCIVDF
jgi:hypothetical protein